MAGNQQRFERTSRTFVRAPGAGVLPLVLGACSWFTACSPAAGGPESPRTPAAEAPSVQHVGSVAVGAVRGPELVGSHAAEDSSLSVAAGAAQETPAANPDIAPGPDEEPERYPFHEPLPGPERLSRAPARRYANLSASQCRAELRKRHLPAKPAGPASGVATPLRLSGTLGKVRFVTPGKRSVYGMLDCRLVLALSDFAELLAEHGVVEVHVDNLYRPKARLPGRRSKKSQHAYGLAVDILALKLEDGRLLLIERDWHGTPKAPPCGPESAPAQTSEEAVLLRNVVCATARAGLFHHLLTPNYDAAHRNHFHFDIKRDARAIVVR